MGPRLSPVPRCSAPQPGQGDSEPGAGFGIKRKPKRCATERTPASLMVLTQEVFIEAPIATGLAVLLVWTNTAVVEDLGARRSPGLYRAERLPMPRPAR